MSIHSQSREPSLTSRRAFIGAGAGLVGASVLGGAGL